MKILLLGSGGREHTFAWKIKQSPLCEALFIAPGNAGTAELGTNVPLNVNDFEAIKTFVLEKAIAMVIVGPEEPLVRGIYDFFKAEEALNKIAIIGPSKKGALLEGSKAYAKEFMARHGIPTAAYKEFSSGQIEAGKAYIQEQQTPIVLKADGLAAGKGVLILEDIAEAQEELALMLDGKFGAASATVVIEEFLSGIEFSVFVLTDGKTYKILPVAKDYKRIGEGDTGLNTGGMGSVSPVSFVDDTLMQKVEERIIRPTVEGIKAENITYKGFIFFGLISVGGDPYVIEYNCRMGDPETQSVFPRLNNDLVDLFQALDAGQLAAKSIQINPKAVASIILVSGGYPEAYEKGKSITALDNVSESLIFHAGTKIVDENLVTNGGRVLALTSYGKTFQEALALSNKNAQLVQFEGKYFRTDIGFDL